MPSVAAFGNLVFDHYFGYLTFEEGHYDKSALSQLRYAVIDISFIAFFSVLGILLTILITRLIYTFRDSIYELNKYFVRTFYIVTILTAVTVFGGYGLETFYPTISAIIQTIAGAIYLISSCIMVITFVKRLNLLIVNSDSESIQKDDIQSEQLNAMQLRLINTASKYLILSFMGFATTLFTVVLNLINTFFFSCLLHRIWIMCIKTDLIVNILCFYLQFGFAAGNYKKCCGFLDFYLKQRMRKRTTTMINEMSNSIESQANTTSKAESAVAFA